MSMNQTNYLSYSQKFGEYVAALSYEKLPQAVVEQVKYFFIDYLAIVLRASTLDSSQPIYNLIKETPFPGKASVIGLKKQTNPFWATLANGTAAHSLELDDTYLEGSIHNEVFLFSTAIAIAEEFKLSGKEFITAIVAGFDIACRIAEALKPAVTNARGFHPTGTVGAIGAAVVSAKLQQLDPQQISNAIGIACSQASGLLEYVSDGAWTKRFHAGWAAHAGAIAGSLARQGFIGPKKALEGKFGFLHAYSGDFILEVLDRDLGTDYLILKSAIKYYPCNYYIQSVNDATLKILHEHQFELTQIEKIEVATVTASYHIVCSPIEEKRNPQSMIDAQFSMPFNVALALLKKQVVFSDLTKETWGHKEIHRLMNLTECYPDPEFDKEFPAAWPARVSIFLKNMSEPLTAEIKYPKGDRRNPLSWQEIIAKHKSIVSGLVNDFIDEKLINFISNLENQKNFEEFSELLQLVI